MNLISCEKLEKSMVELQFSIDAETFKNAVNAAFKREGKKYNVPGFRRGKAPRHMIEKLYGAEVFHYDAVNDLFPAEYEAAVKAAGIEVVGAPEPEVVSMNETDGATLKVKVAIENGLRPILCVGESLTEREQDVTMEVIRKQIKIALQGVAVEDIKKVVIAYEPIWAIGTGKTATAEQANEVCSAIRDCLREKYGARAARGITIQYGGSMNAKNAAELLAQPDVDGGLIGGASLKSADFATIVEAANQ